jgi:hypothetical protein
VDAAEILLVIGGLRFEFQLVKNNPWRGGPTQVVLGPGVVAHSATILKEKQNIETQTLYGTKGV